MGSLVSQVLAFAEQTPQYTALGRGRLVIIPSRLAGWPAPRLNGTGTALGRGPKFLGQTFSGNSPYEPASPVESPADRGPAPSSLKSKVRCLPIWGTHSRSSAASCSSARYISSRKTVKVLNCCGLAYTDRGCRACRRANDESLRQLSMLDVLGRRFRVYVSLLFSVSLQPSL